MGVQVQLEALIQVADLQRVCRPACENTMIQWNIIIRSDNMMGNEMNSSGPLKVPCAN